MKKLNVGVLMLFAALANSCDSRSKNIRPSDYGSCELLGRQRVMLYQNLGKFARDKSISEDTRKDINQSMIELYFPYYVHCRISGEDDSVLLEMIRSRAKYSRGYIKRMTDRNWETIRANPAMAGYDPSDIGKIYTYDSFRELVEEYSKDLGIEVR